MKPRSTASAASNTICTAAWPASELIHFWGRRDRADHPELEQSMGVFGRQLGILLFELGALVVGRDAARKPAIEHRVDGFPIETGDLAGHQDAVAAQALHQRADDLDTG